MARRWLGTALVGSILWLALGTSGAHAQVAAPSIVPGTFTSDNPAAIKWGAPSRVGFGVLTMETVDQPGNLKASYSGASAGFRGVGENFAFGLSTLHVADQEGDIKDISDITSAALALQTGNTLAWGLGYFSDKVARDNFDSDTKESIFGVSVRLGELWFIGAAIGRESVNEKDTSLPSKLSAERDTLRYGIGFRRGGTVLVHIEAFGGTKDELKDGSDKRGSESSLGGTVEFAFGPILLAASSQRVTYHDAPFTKYADVMTGDFGWAPRQGFSLVAHFESRYLKLDEAATGVDYHKEERTGVLLTWQF